MLLIKALYPIFPFWNKQNESIVIKIGPIVSKCVANNGSKSFKLERKKTILFQDFKRRICGSFLIIFIVLWEMTFFKVILFSRSGDVFQ